MNSDDADDEDYVPSPPPPRRYKFRCQRCQQKVHSEKWPYFPRPEFIEPSDKASGSFTVCDKCSVYVVFSNVTDSNAFLSSRNQAQLRAFFASMYEIEALTYAVLPTIGDLRLQLSLTRLLYVNVVTALETYLGDSILSRVKSDRETLRRAVENIDYFKNISTPVSKVFQRHERIEHEAATYLSDLLWHRLPAASAIYREVLGVRFPKNMAALIRAVANRHDIVHRGGKKKNGEELAMASQDVRQLITAAKELVIEIDSQLA